MENPINIEKQDRLTLALRFADLSVKKSEGKTSAEENDEMEKIKTQTGLDNETLVALGVELMNGEK